MHWTINNQNRPQDIGKTTLQHGNATAHKAKPVSAGNCSPTIYQTWLLSTAISFHRFETYGLSSTSHPTWKSKIAWLIGLFQETNSFTDEKSTNWLKHTETCSQQGSILWIKCLFTLLLNISRMYKLCPR